MFVVFYLQGFDVAFSSQFCEWEGFELCQSASDAKKQIMDISNMMMLTASRHADELFQ